MIFREIESAEDSGEVVPDTNTFGRSIEIQTQDKSSVMYRSVDMSPQTFISDVTPCTATHYYYYDYDYSYRRHTLHTVTKMHLQPQSRECEHPF